MQKPAELPNGGEMSALLLPYRGGFLTLNRPTIAQQMDAQSALQLTK
jgi:hypothetical protein